MAEPFRRPLSSPLSAAGLILLLLLLMARSVGASEVPDTPFGLGFPRTLHRLIDQHEGASGAYVLEKGEEALLARGWMVENAVESIDVLTFIWSLDDVGLLATDALLKAAERGVNVRVVVDDMLLNSQPLDILLALAAHPQIEIRVYNPVRSVGVSPLKLLANVLTDLRRFNSRLHNKSIIADRVIAICGGRNVANEYFDYSQEYNFRDRDILVLGPVVDSMRQNFEEFWESPLSQPIEELIPEPMAGLSPEVIRQIYTELDSCARMIVDRLPIVQGALENRQERLNALLQEMTWSKEVLFVSDEPGKNLGKPGLGGGGKMAEALEEAIRSARERVTIQSPYLVLPEGGFGLWDKRKEGLPVRISTNSLASTDNISAFSGYSKVRDDLLTAGMTVREFRPHPAIEEELVERYVAGKKPPIFVLHAKTVVIDGELLYVGTFNLDPRSANLNTEEGVFVRSRELASRVEKQIEEEMKPQNSWNPAEENPNRHAGMWRQVKFWFLRLLPIDPLL